MLPEVDLDIPEHNGKKERDIVVAIEHVGASSVPRLFTTLMMSIGH